MGYFPFFVEIGGKKGVIAGGGPVAARKAEKLLPFGPRLLAVAPRTEKELEKLAKESGGRLEIARRKIEEADLEGACFAIAATDEEEVNRQVCRWCGERNIPVNAADRPELCTFYFPGLVREGPLTVAVSTEGKSPVASAFLRSRIERSLPAGIGRTVELLGRLRPEVLARVPDQRRRAAILETLFAYCMERQGEVEPEELLALFAQMEETA